MTLPTNVAEAVKVEREACAKQCDHLRVIAFASNMTDDARALYHAADAIRARK